MRHFPVIPEIVDLSLRRSSSTERVCMFYSLWWYRHDVLRTRIYRYSSSDIRYVVSLRTTTRYRSPATGSGSLTSFSGASGRAKCSQLAVQKSTLTLDLPTTGFLARVRRPGTRNSFLRRLPPSRSPPRHSESSTEPDPFKDYSLEILSPSPDSQVRRFDSCTAYPLTLCCYSSAASLCPRQFFSANFRATSLRWNHGSRLLDHLNFEFAQLLRESHGRESSSVRSFFRFHSSRLRTR